MLPVPAIFVLYLEGRSFKIIGSDGGLLEHPQTVTEALLTPGERIDIVVGPFAEGETFTMESLPYNRMTFLKAKREIFATVKWVCQSLPLQLSLIRCVYRTVGTTGCKSNPAD